MKTQAEQKEFFKSLSAQLDAFPQQYCKLKILPLLLNAFEFGSAGSTVLAPLFKVNESIDYIYDIKYFSPRLAAFFSNCFVVDVTFAVRLERAVSLLKKYFNQLVYE